MTAGLPLSLPRSIGFLLLPGFSMLAFFAALEPLRLANQLLGQRHHSWRIFTADGRPARSSCGMTVPADAHGSAGFGEQDPACLFVVSGFDPWPQPDRRLKNWLRGLGRRGVILGAVDTGAFLLASAELLGNMKVVVHWESAAAFSELFPDVILSENPYEIDGRHFMCAGGTSALDMMIALMDRTHGSALATGIAERLIFTRGTLEPRGGRPALNEQVPLSDPDLSRVIKLMEERLESGTGVAEIAAAAGVSKRTLERKFRRLLNKTPTQVYLQCRLEQARRLLRNSDLSMREIALACGFSSMSYFCRTYKRHFRLTPGSDRRLDYSLVEPEAAIGCGGGRGTARPSWACTEQDDQRLVANGQRAAGCDGINAEGPNGVSRPRGLCRRRGSGDDA